MTKYGLVEAAERGTEVVETLPLGETDAGVDVEGGGAVRDGAGEVMMMMMMMMVRGGGDWRRGRGGAVGREVSGSLRSGPVWDSVEFGQSG